MSQRPDQSKSKVHTHNLTFQFYLYSEKEMDQVYIPIASAPYLLFPNEKQPLKKLLEQELPLKLDIEFDFVVRAEQSEKKLKIPYDKFSQHSEPEGDRRLSFKKLKSYLQANEAELELPKDWLKDEDLLANVLSLVC